MRPGDLIAFDSSDRVPGADHVGICTGNGQMIDAPQSGMNVQATGSTAGLLLRPIPVVRPPYRWRHRLNTRTPARTAPYA